MGLSQSEKNKGFASLKEIWKRKMGQVEQPPGEKIQEVRAKAQKDSRDGAKKDSEINRIENKGKGGGQHGSNVEESRRKSGSKPIAGVEDQNPDQSRSHSNSKKKLTSNHPMGAAVKPVGEPNMQEEGGRKKKKKKKKQNREGSESGDDADSRQEYSTKQQKQKVDAGHSKGHHMEEPSAHKKGDIKKKKKKQKREDSESGDVDSRQEDSRKQKKQRVDAGPSKGGREDKTEIAAGSKAKLEDVGNGKFKQKKEHNKNKKQEQTISKHDAYSEADSPAAGPRPVFPFRTDESDHAETPFEAYEDVATLLKSLAKSMGKKPKDLRIYDPYYCGGTVKKHFASLGFPRCYNEMEDFYEFAERGGKGPGEYDVLVTNPPYSADHVERLFKFCSKTRDKPAFLLLPHFFYTEPYFKPTLGDQSLIASLFFLCPGLGRRYRYLPPTWAGISQSEGADDPSAPAGIAPFPSFWYCLGGPNTKALVKHFRLVNEPGPGSAGQEPASPASRLALYQNRVFVVRTTSELPNELKSEFDLGRKRPNPRARKKLAKIRQEMSGGEGPAAPPPSSKRSAVWRQRAQQKRKEAMGGGPG